MDSPKVGSKWLHKKKGIVYEVICRDAVLQCSTMREFEDMWDDDVFVVYRNARTGLTAVRPLPEFMDGRFELVEDAR